MLITGPIRTICPVVLHEPDIMKFLCDKIGDGLFSGDQFVQMRRREVKRKAGIRQYQLQLSVCVVVDRQVDAVVKRLAERINGIHENLLYMYGFG